MTTEFIYSAGAWGGDILLAKSRENPRGFFENLAIRQNVSKPFLKRHGFDPMGQNPLPDRDAIAKWKNDLALHREIRQKVFSILIDQGYSGGPWFYKGAKMILMWPVWRYAFPNAKWIYVWRNELQIIQSCLRTRFMKAYKDAEGWRGWIAVHQRRLAELMSSGIDVHQFDSDLAVQGDYNEVRKMIRFCGLNIDESKIDEIIIR